MVQFTLAYVALGFATLLVLGGLLALFSLRSRGTSISPVQRLALVGGLAGMVVFIIVSSYLRLR
jgi:hypothetical protein